LRLFFCSIGSANLSLPFGNITLALQKKKGRAIMNTLGRLEKLLLQGEITEEEYRKKKTVYVETLLDLYCRDYITEEELRQKLNK
jgi:hypothetical protein